jgi:hypothetical protein
VRATSRLGRHEEGTAQDCAVGTWGNFADQIDPLLLHALLPPPLLLPLLPLPPFD